VVRGIARKDIGHIAEDARGIHVFLAYETSAPCQRPQVAFYGDRKLTCAPYPLTTRVVDVHLAGGAVVAEDVRGEGGHDVLEVVDVRRVGVGVDVVREHLVTHAWFAESDRLESGGRREVEWEVDGVEERDGGA
jgi:hypothetical protein